MRRAPGAPSGGPSPIAPPVTFTLSPAGPRALSPAPDWPAHPSFVSHKPTPPPPPPAPPRAPPEAAPPPHPLDPGGDLLRARDPVLAREVVGGLRHEQPAVGVLERPPQRVLELGPRAQPQARA